MRAFKNVTKPIKMLSIPISQNYTWQLTPSGHPDMRKAQNRRNVCDMASQLHRKLEQTKNENNVLKSKERLKCDSNCLICTEEIQGPVILKCGHTLCASCFAQHARVSNKCPFCRDQFAPPPKKLREQMPPEIIDALADRWTTHHGDQGYFALVEHNVTQLEEGAARQQFLKWFVCENSKVLMRQVSEWYNA